MSISRLAPFLLLATFGCLSADQARSKTIQWSRSACESALRDAREVLETDPNRTDIKEAKRVRGIARSIVLKCDPGIEIDGVDPYKLKQALEEHMNALDPCEAVSSAAADRMFFGTDEEFKKKSPERLAQLKREIAYEKGVDQEACGQSWDPLGGIEK